MLSPFGDFPDIVVTSQRFLLSMANVPVGPAWPEFAKTLSRPWVRATPHSVDWTCLSSIVVIAQALSPRRVSTKSSDDVGEYYVGALG